jgi:hypothetical protein
MPAIRTDNLTKSFRVRQPAPAGQIDGVERTVFRERLARLIGGFAIGGFIDRPVSQLSLDQRLHCEKRFPRPRREFHWTRLTRLSVRSPNTIPRSNKLSVCCLAEWRSPLRLIEEARS